MTDLLSLISHHGYLLLAIVCFAEAVGLPLPAALAILTAGAVAAYGHLHFYFVFGIALLTMIAGDILLYFMGRVSGWALLGFLCRLSANPETCILRSAEYFYRRGKQTLLFAKFIPGINTMSPPLAGSMKMRLGDFLQYDALGAALYVGAYSVAGYLFSDALRAITRGLRSAGSAAELVFAIGLVAYVVYRIWVYRKYRLLDAIPRIPAEELARRLASEAAQNMRSQASTQGSRDLSLLYLSARSHQRPCGAPTTGSRIQGVRNRRWPDRLAQGWTPRGKSPHRRPGKAANLQLMRLSFERARLQRLRKPGPGLCFEGARLQPRRKH